MKRQIAEVLEDKYTREDEANRFFVGYALSCGLAFSAMFAYISGSPFVLQDICGLSPQLFSIIFGMNALAMPP